MNPLETCLHDLNEIRSSGAARLCAEAGITAMHFSLTDEDAQALAVVLLEK